ncbi:MAG TPA: helix-turn-helix domain-containing protein [Ramlibacter sp.]|jgi:cytoskeleton protein RodZ|nr:helix-turn-helix domain-containing protein [Ramlibacter sp.]
MSENATPVDGVTAGKLLREAREAAGLHLDTLAANLKVPPAKLDALENDRYDLLPDAVFVRGLASSVCRTLKLDPQPVLQRLPQTGQPRLMQDNERINAPFRSPNDGPAPGLLDQLGRPVVLTVAALLLGALVLVFLPLVQRGIETVAQASRQPDPVMPPPGAAVTLPEAAPEGSAAPMPGNAASAALPAAMPAPAPGPAPTAAAVTPAPDANAVPRTTGPGEVQAGNPQLRASTSTSMAPAAAAPQPAAAAQPAASAAATAASGAPGARGVVVFRTRGPSWVQVTDATGTTVLRKLMEPGESAGVNGALPLTVTVGSAENTEVQVRGKPYNLAPVSRDNVARFEVK